VNTQRAGQGENRRKRFALWILSLRRQAETASEYLSKGRPCTRRRPPYNGAVGKARTARNGASTSHCRPDPFMPRGREKGWNVRAQDQIERTSPAPLRAGRKGYRRLEGGRSISSPARKGAGLVRSISVLGPVRSIPPHAHGHEWIRFAMNSCLLRFWPPSNCAIVGGLRRVLDAFAQVFAGRFSLTTGKRQYHKANLFLVGLPLAQHVACSLPNQIWQRVRWGITQFRSRVRLPSKILYEARHPLASFQKSLAMVTRYRRPIACPLSS